MEARKKMNRRGLTKFGIYKPSLILQDYEKQRSPGQKLCFLSCVAAVFFLSVVITLLDYTNAQVTTEKMPTVRFDRMYSNHRHNSSVPVETTVTEHIKQLEEDKENKPSNLFLNNSSSYNDNESIAKIKYNSFKANNDYVPYRVPKSRNMYNNVNTNSDISKTYSGYNRRQYRGYNGEPREQRIMNNPPFYTESNLFNIDHSVINPLSPMNLFTESYAQLRPYSHYHNVKSVNEILHFVDPSQVFITTAAPDLASSKMKKFKFTGTYVRAMDDESGESSEEVPTVMQPPGQTDQARPFFQGQNFTDPFKMLRPFNALEINRLLPSLADEKLNPREHHENAYPYMPTPPFRVKPDVSVNPASVQIPTTSAGSKTVAIFHPLDPGSLQSATEQRQYRKKRKRPFSLMLDIYPVQNGVGGVAAATNTKYATIPHHLWGPYRPLPGNELQQQATNHFFQPDNRMVVHLNLYPTRYGRSQTFRRGRSNKEDLMAVLSGGTFSKKSSGHIGDAKYSRNNVFESEIEVNQVDGRST